MLCAQIGIEGSDLIERFKRLRFKNHIVNPTSRAVR
jgi:hypothetical protein